MDSDDGQEHDLVTVPAVRIAGAADAIRRRLAAPSGARSCDPDLGVPLSRALTFELVLSKVRLLYRAGAIAELPTRDERVEWAAQQDDLRGYDRALIAAAVLSIEDPGAFAFGSAR